MKPKTVERCEISGGLSLTNLFQAAGMGPKELLVIRDNAEAPWPAIRVDATGPDLLPYE
jgi:hypothetical protein